jgi:hypothetical protein
VLSACPAVTTTEVRDINGEAPGGVADMFGSAAAGTTEVEDVDGGPLGGAGGISGSGHYRSPFGIHEVSELKVWEHPPLT